jgi:hypothetical protein
MIAIAESSNKPRTVGDNGLAGGLFQMHFEWRLDYWHEWMWEALAVIDRRALEYFIVTVPSGLPRPPATARALADLFNTGHPAPDPSYDLRCLKALEAMGIISETFDTIVE